MDGPRRRADHDEVHAPPKPSRRRSALVGGFPSHEDTRCSSASDAAPIVNGIPPDRLEALLVELDELWRPSRVKWTVLEVPKAAGLKLSHRAMTREWADQSHARRGVTFADIEDLEEAGLIAVDWGFSNSGRRGELRLTPAGEAHVDRLASPPPQPAAPIGSDWQRDVLPLLMAAAEIEQNLPPGGGVTQDALNGTLQRSAGDPQTATTLVQLSEAGYLRDELSVEEVDGPIGFRLGEKALQRIAGWPGAGVDLASELLGLIDQRLGDPTVSEDERTRLRRLRDTVGDVGRGVVTGLLTALIKSHTGV